VRPNHYADKGASVVDTLQQHKRARMTGALLSTWIHGSGPTLTLKRWRRSIHIERQEG
jgi:hypothetical protein